MEVFGLAPDEWSCFSASAPGSKVLIRCIKLLKPYGKKTPSDFDDDEYDEDDDDYTEGGGRVLPSEGRIMERDVMSQAYHISKLD